MSEKTKKCPKCGEEIFQGAKKCKHCNSDLRNWFAKHPLWTALIIIIALPTFISGIMSGVNPSSVSSDNQGVSQNNEPTIDIVSIDTKITERNSVWSKFSWVLKLKNNTDRQKSVSVDLKWVDEGGFVLDDHQEYNLKVPANQEATFNDYILIDASVADNVVGVEAEVK